VSDALTKEEPYDGPVDCMGYPVAPVMFDLTPAAIEYARSLAKASGYRWDVVGEDPRVAGKRFVEAAREAQKVFALEADRAALLEVVRAAQWVFVAPLGEEPRPMDKLWQALSALPSHLKDSAALGPASDGA
jgi:hypothetical protein